jgi:hypothetical protein
MWKALLMLASAKKRSRPCPRRGLPEFPEEMIWLWRNYDSAKITQAYEIDPDEKTKPPFRVSVTNRAAE